MINFLKYSIIAVVLLMLFSSCEEYNDDDGRWRMVLGNCSNSDGSVKIQSGEIWGDNFGLVVSHEGRIMIAGRVYRFSNLSYAMSWSNSGKNGKWNTVLIEIGSNRTATLVVEKIHSNTEITISISGFINLKNVRLHYDDSPWNINDAKLYAYSGHKGLIIQNLTPAVGATADGTSQLAISIGEYDKIENFRYETDCTGDWGSLSAPKKIPGSDSYYVIYTAPEWSYGTNDREKIVDIFFDFEVTEYGNKKKTETINTSIRLIPPAIGLVHGLFSNNESEGCFSDFHDYLVDTGYSDSEIQLIDYKKTNATSFNFNTFAAQIISKQLEQLYNTLLSEGIISTRYILCGHSMGGILSRYYAQFINPDGVYKIITLDTPHWGSELADFGEIGINLLTNGTNWPLSQLINQSYSKDYGRLSAIRDLKTTSEAIETMNSKGIENLSGIGCHAVCSYFDETNPLNYTSKSPLYNDDKPILTLRQANQNQKKEIIFVVLQFFEGKYNEQIQLEVLSALYRNTKHDAVVAMHSQRGGLAKQYCTMQFAPYSGFLGVASKAHHINTNNWKEATYENLRKLFLMPISSGLFAVDGFRSRENAKYNTNQQQTFHKACKISNDNSEHLELKISDIKEHSLEVEIISTSGIINSLIIAQADEDGIDCSACSKKYTIEYDSNTSKIEIGAIGRTQDNKLYYIQKTITL